MKLAARVWRQRECPPRDQDIVEHHERVDLVEAILGERIVARVAPARKPGPADVLPVHSS